MAQTQERKLSSWIESFVEFNSLRAAPKIYLEWCALSTIAGALERRCWVQTNAGELYPNLYLLLVGAPGSGKDQAIMQAREFWLSTHKVNLSPLSMTGKGLLDELAEESSQRQYIDHGLWINYHTMIVAVPEFGVLLPGHDLQFMSILNELYECHPLFEERLRKQEERFRIERPHLHILAGTQPNFLAAVLPETAFGMGFMSRIIMVYHPTPTRMPLFTKPKFNASLQSHLAHDLEQVCAMRGQFSFDADVLIAVEAWHIQGCIDTMPTHSKLRHYSARRILHALKLSMAFSAARSNSLIVTLADWTAALKQLYAAEVLMPEIFKEMSANSQNAVMEEVVNFCISLPGLVRESQIHTFLASRVPSYQVSSTFDLLLKAGVVVPDGLNLPGQRMFKVTGPQKLETGK